MGVDSPLARRLIRQFVGESAKQIAEIERATVRNRPSATLK
jgi:hypothetical protein